MGGGGQINLPPFPVQFINDTKLAISDTVYSQDIVNSSHSSPSPQTPIIPCHFFYPQEKSAPISSRKYLKWNCSLQKLHQIRCVLWRRKEFKYATIPIPPPSWTGVESFMDMYLFTYQCLHHSGITFQSMKTMIFFLQQCGKSLCNITCRLLWST